MALRRHFSGHSGTFLKNDDIFCFKYRMITVERAFDSYDPSSCFTHLRHVHISSRNFSRELQSWKKILTFDAMEKNFHRSEQKYTKNEQNPTFCAFSCVESFLRVGWT